MKYKTGIMLLAVIAVTLFSTSMALSQSGETTEATFYVH
jgi:hypothetical protein